jgi:RpiB/LacA/LacB family sugar-phosphate isomerase
MKIALGADHAGFEMKEELKAAIIEAGHDVLDLGAESYEPLDDYPDYSAKVARAVAAREADRGVLICGSGIGASIAANKIKGVRAGAVSESYGAHQGVEHDDMNVLVLGSRVMGIEVAREALKAYLNAEFSGEERHVRRLNKVLVLEEEGR